MKIKIKLDSDPIGHTTTARVSLGEIHNIKAYYNDSFNFDKLSSDLETMIDDVIRRNETPLRAYFWKYFHRFFK